ncbi:MAG TPA: flagellar hook-associated protein FlgK [Rhodanobacter sp.]|jgi:flagellar hook-associated protein 1 FlgK|nr:flagellar hook-associated protein FlgK [Rhodanobacter sp.]
MADMLSTGVSGLLAAQVGMGTVSHNVANVNTEGYSRQLVSFGARAPEWQGGFYVGTGVDTMAVQRAYSQFLNNSLWSAAAGQGRADTMASLTTQINSQVSGSTNLQTALDSFYGAVQDMANAPADAASRQAVLARAGALASTFTSLSGQFNQLAGQVKQQLTETVDSINSDSASIAKLNGLIRTAAGNNGMPPADLLDQRDALVKKLAGEVGISVVPQTDNTLNIYVGNGQALVTNAEAHALGTAPNQYDATRVDIVGSGGSVISGRIGGGTLGALLDFRSNVLDPAQTQLGRAAQAMAATFNAQQAQGVDLQGAIGGPMFSVAGPIVQAASSNGGSSTLDATITDLGTLTGKDYVLRYDGSTWTLQDTSGASVAMTGTGTAADPFQAAGLSLVVGGAAAPGDSFRVQPSRNAASSFAVVMSDPNKVAAAAPLTVSSASTNSGAAVPGFGVADGSNPAFFNASSVVFSSPTSYSIDGGPAQAYTPGTPITHNGWSLKLDGTPAAGDTFNVAANTNARGDNSNALALGKVANQGVLDGGVTSVGRAYSQMVTQIGSAGAVATADQTTQKAVFNQAMTAQQSVSGVNLDEEAANLVRYQQAYQASAQVISTASTLFQSLLTAVQSV